MDMHPIWLERPSCKVVVIAGPSGSGKTTYAVERCGPDDEIIDLDDCFSDVCGVHGHNANRAFLECALSLRNERLHSLSKKCSGTAYVIVGAPTEQERLWWAEVLCASVVLLDTSYVEIRSRPISDRRKILAREWDEKKLMPWSPPTVPTKIGVDGYPQEEPT